MIRFSALLGLACATVAIAADHGLPLKVIADVPLPGDTSRFDYESYDPQRHRLFIAHLGASEMLVFDTGTQKVVGRVTGLAHVHGVLAIPERGRVYASATGTDEVVAIDADTLAVLARIPGGRYPDGMAYVPAAHKLYVSDETGATETVIDVRENRRVATIPLGGEVGNTQFDPVSGHVFVNVQARAELVEIDPGSDQVIRRYELPGAKGNHGLQIVPALRLALIACEDNDRLLVFDLASPRVTASVEVGGGPDVLAFDEAQGWLYVASESGVVSVFSVRRGSVSKVGEGLLGPDAHVVAVDPATHRAWFPLRNFEGRAILRITEPRPAP